MTIGTSCPLSYYNLSCNIVLTHRGEIDEDDYQGRVALVAIIVAIVAVMYGARFLNNASNSKESTSTLIKNVEKVNELVLVNAGIQKVITKENNVKLPWTQYGIPFSERKSLLVLNYTAKFGIKKPVKISEKAIIRLKSPFQSMKLLALKWIRTIRISCMTTVVLCSVLLRKILILVN